jgi:hypothetical protein
VAELVRVRRDRAREPPDRDPGRDRAPDRALGGPGCEESRHGPRGRRLPGSLSDQGSGREVPTAHRVVTDNGACYRSGDFARIIGNQTRHQRTKPYTPRHNGKVEHYQRILAEELLYARKFTSESARTAAIAVWNVHYNYHRPHSGAGGQPPASRLHRGVTNVQPSYSQTVR